MLPAVATAIPPDAPTPKLRQVEPAILSERAGLETCRTAARREDTGEPAALLRPQREAPEDMQPQAADRREAAFTATRRACRLQEDREVEAAIRKTRPPHA